jgi:glycosyltransferase involved in cell wall biosynthesis
MVSITKGEGFGRPLLEFTMTGKPIIASNWSGHKDFLPMDKSIMIGGKLTDVHSSAINDYIIKDSKWFTANYSEVVEVMKIVKKDYESFSEKSLSLMEENKEKFSLLKMKEKFLSIITPFIDKPKELKLNLPILTKI